MLAKKLNQDETVLETKFRIIYADRAAQFLSEVWRLLQSEGSDEIRAMRRERPHQ
jgi:hypothetical protein